MAAGSIAAQPPVQDTERVRLESYQQQYNAASAEYQRQYDVVWREYQKAGTEASSERERQIDEAKGERQQQVDSASREYWKRHNGLATPRPDGPEAWAAYQQQLNEVQ
jgi:hypothetical protein